MQQLKLESASISPRIWWLIAALLITFASAALVLFPRESATAEALNQGIDFGDWKTTERVCVQILAKNPSDADALIARALVFRGLALCSIGRSKIGQSDLKLYLAITPLSSDFDLRYRRGVAFDCLKDSKSAEK